MYGHCGVKTLTFPFLMPRQVGVTQPQVKVRYLPFGMMSQKADSAATLGIIFS